MGVFSSYFHKTSQLFVLNFISSVSRLAKKFRNIDGNSQTSNVNFGGDITKMRFLCFDGPNSKSGKKKVFRLQQEIYNIQNLYQLYMPKVCCCVF